MKKTIVYGSIVSLLALTTLFYFSSVYADDSVVDQSTSPSQSPVLFLVPISLILLLCKITNIRQT